MWEAVKQLGLARFSLTPHAVRHTGPSWDFMNRARTADEIMSRVRWQTLKSIQRYRKPGQMVAKMNRIPQEIWDRACDRAHGALPAVLTRLRQFCAGS